ncbi:hypothetical protein HK097_008031 [Rhizophlyctis rosea]|uniref:GH16 domain-containing protein n=1 Tax=Rhizophlyctis rosea TaxID=64517 RepID=A0AAD5X1A5_9FUNG|nr:hypothetical protein HK097_008031 [Rhizophlyctis rosea]
MSTRLFVLAALAAAVVHAEPQPPPNATIHTLGTGKGACKSGNWTLGDSTLWRDPGFDGHYLPIDHNPEQYPWVILNNPPGFNYGPGGVTLTLNQKVRSRGGMQGAYGRYVRYARITAKMMASTQSGLVTTFITMSDRGDEIDWETVGKDVNNIQSNLWWNSRALEEGNPPLDPNVGRHGDVHPVANIGASHIYELDWKSTGLTWSIDGRVVRSITPTTENAKAVKLPNGTNYYPTEPSLIKIGLWDNSKDTPDSWAGKADWSRPDAAYSATFDWLAIQCYDDNNQPVGSFGDMKVPTALVTTTTGAATAKHAPTDIAAPPPGDKSTGNGGIDSGVVNVVGKGGIVPGLAALVAAGASLVL